MASRYASTQVWDFDLVRAANADAGKHFWSPDTTRFFRARDGEVYQGPGGVFFSHSIRGPHDGGARWYVVSQFFPETAQVLSVKLPDGALSFSTFREAHKHARALALSSPTPATGRASGGCSSCGHIDHDGFVCHHVSGEDEPVYCDCDRTGSDD